MATFKTIREAKEYLAGKIVEEAEREGVPLTEVERKMLYFTETGWTLPGMKAVSAEFDRDYDQDAYERKIGDLVGGLRIRNDAENKSDADMWDDAVLKLCDEDHYLLVLIDGAAKSGSEISPRWEKLRLWLPSSSQAAKKAPGDEMRLVVAAVVGFVIMGLLILLRDYLRDRAHF